MVVVYGTVPNPTNSTDSNGAARRICAEQIGGMFRQDARERTLTPIHLRGVCLDLRSHCVCVCVVNTTVCVRVCKDVLKRPYCHM